MFRLNREQALTGLRVRRASQVLTGFLMAATCLTGVWALASVSQRAEQTASVEDQPNTAAIIQSQSADVRRELQDDGCGEREPAVRLPTTKLFIEHNATDEDTGVHGAFDGVDWQKLCVFDPGGRLVLEVEPHGQLRNLSISGIFFESREPPNEEVPIARILAWFPEGLYAVRGRALDGRRLTGAATFTHNIPAAPVIVFPRDGETVSAAGFTVMWNPVLTTLDGRPLKTTAYQVIITKDVPDDPHGFSRPTFDVHVPPSERSLTVPREFLEPKTHYELEVLGLEVSGNQTISSLFFKTQ